MLKVPKNLMIIFILACSGVSGFLVSLWTHRNVFIPQTIPTFHYPERLALELAHDPEAGKKIFTEFCATCHAKKPMIDIRAPRIGDKKIWRALKKNGIPSLLNITIQGINAMPARGGCFECSDDELKAAIQYILDNSSSN